MVRTCMSSRKCNDNLFNITMGSRKRIEMLKKEDLRRADATKLKGRTQGTNKCSSIVNSIIYEIGTDPPANNHLESFVRLNPNGDTYTLLKKNQ